MIVLVIFIAVWMANLLTDRITRMIDRHPRLPAGRPETSP
jgi:hypothetical protein